MSSSTDLQIKLHYQNIIDIWEKFCVLHKELYDLTCAEYLILLEGDLEKLESLIPNKENIIAEVNLIEEQRAQVIIELNQINSQPDIIHKASDLIHYFTSLETENNLFALKNLNDLLIDIIERLQEQNKKNQLFLNKAMLSIQDLKQGFSGKKVFTTYGSDGMTRAINK